MNLEKHNLIVFCRWIKRFFDFIKDSDNQKAICRDEAKNGPAFIIYNHERLRLLGLAEQVLKLIRGEVAGQRKELSNLLKYCAEYHRLLNETLQLFKKSDTKGIESRLHRLNEIHNLIHHGSRILVEQLDNGTIY